MASLNYEAAQRFWTFHLISEEDGLPIIAWQPQWPTKAIYRFRNTSIPYYRTYDYVIYSRESVFYELALKEFRSI